MNHRDTRTVVIENVHRYKIKCTPSQTNVLSYQCSPSDSRRGPQLKYIRTHPSIAATSFNGPQRGDPLPTKLHLSLGACAVHAVPMPLLLVGVAILTRGEGRHVVTIVLAVRGWGTFTKLHLLNTGC